MDFNYDTFDENTYNDRRFEKTRKGVICPHCGSVPRLRLIAAWLSREKKNLVSKDVLMVAPEKLIMRLFDGFGWHYTTTDLFDESVDVKADIQATPFRDNSWSLILCNHVLEHVDDYRRALRELYRILNKGGTLELTVPLDNNLEHTYENKSITTREGRVENFGQWDHIRVFGLDFREAILEAGFDLTVVSGEDFSGEIVPVIGPADYGDNHIFVCKK
jgi:predicted SAM-dependent methyltransferase